MDDEELSKFGDAMGGLCILLAWLAVIAFSCM